MVKVTLLGASGGIGQSLSLLLRLNEDISELALFDIKNSIGVATDLSHIPTRQNVSGYEPSDKSNKQQIQMALKKSDIVIITAGIPRKPSMTRNDLFKVNASIIKSLVRQFGSICPDAFLCIVSNPVNSLVPVAAEQLKRMNVYNPKKVLGISTLDNVRLEQFLSEYLKIDPRLLKNDVTCIGGHSGNTIVPIIGAWRANFSNKVEYDVLIKRVQYGGDEVVKAKNGAGSATLSTALAINRFVASLVDVIVYDIELKEVAYINVGQLHSKIIQKDAMFSEYFCLPIVLSKEGVRQIIYPKILASEERDLVSTAVACINKDIKRGADMMFGAKLYLTKYGY